MRNLFAPRRLGTTLTLLLLLALVLPAQAAPGRLEPELVAYLAGAPGGQGPFLILLAEQADLRGAPLITARTARVTYVYEALRATADRTQAGLRADLAAWGVDYHPFYIVNAIRVTGDLALARRVAGRPEVARLIPDPAFDGIDDPPAGPAGPPAVDGVEWNVARVHAPDVWALGHTGQGIVVGSVDTGVEYTHPALVNQYRGNLGGGSFDHNYNWYEPDGTSVEPYDPNSHGTHTTGTMVGDDGGANQVGVAPGAQWIACKADSNGVWQASKYIACWEWMLAPTDLNGANPNPALAAHVVNNSWSCPEEEGCDPDTLLPAAQALYAAGIAIAKSGGNAGSACQTITNPGQYSELLATGAFNSSDVIASFSSRGPSIYQSETRVKPDIAAPGSSVRSAIPGGAYGSKSGTSMASPHTAGVIALLWSAEPALVGDMESTYQAIKLTAEVKIDAQCAPYVDHPNDVWGWGILSALVAAQPGGLQGTVYGAGMVPLPGSVVAVEPVGGGEVHEATADANALYTLTLPAGHYVITATHPGYLPGAGAVAVFSGTTTTHDIVLEPLPACAPVTGADFDWAPMTPTVGQVVSFTGWVSGTPPVTYTWDLGDGTLRTGEVVTHSYGQPGDYVVVLTATNCATATAAAAHTVTVAGVPRIVAPVDVPPVTLELGQQAAYSFTVANTGTAALEWSLAEAPQAPWLEESPAGGTVDAGSSTTIQITYTAPLTTGVYTTVLRLDSNDPLSPSVELAVELAVVEACVPAAITAITPTVAGCTVGWAAALAGDPPFSYLWAFGDGLTSTAAMPTHTYALSGIYSGTLEVANCGGVATQGFVVTVECAGPPPSFAIYLPLVGKGDAP